MAREGVSYEEYKLAADRLHSEGVKPTVRKVRAELGTGSNGTLLKHQSCWLEEQHLKVDLAKLELPQPFLDAARSMVSNLVSESTQLLEDKCADFQAQVAEDQRLLSEGEEVSNNLRGELNKLKAIQFY